MKKSVNDIGGENWGPILLDQKDTPDWAKLSTALRGASLTLSRRRTVKSARITAGPMPRTCTFRGWLPRCCAKRTSVSCSRVSGV